jgi:glycosyltransferase involved in cell wall biosynthesis
MTPITVGVVIPTYQRVEQTVAAVDSALAQTVAPAQIVVVDDGSDDELVNVLAEQLKLRKVELLRQKHTAHPGRVRDAGIRRLETSHIAFLDSDDVWYPTKLERQVALAAEGHRAIFTGYDSVAHAGGERVSRWVPTKGEIGSRELARSNIICNSSVLVARELLDKIGGLPTNYAVRGLEDYAAWFRVSHFENWIGVGEPLLAYLDDASHSIRSTVNCLIPSELLLALDTQSWLRNSGKNPWQFRLGSFATRMAIQNWSRSHSPKF